jgi:hypothetical protein
VTRIVVFVYYESPIKFLTTGFLFHRRMMISADDLGRCTNANCPDGGSCNMFCAEDEASVTANRNPLPLRCICGCRGNQHLIIKRDIPPPTSSLKNPDKPDKPEYPKNGTSSFGKPDEVVCYSLFFPSVSSQ